MSFSMIWAGHMSHMWDRKGAYRVLLEKPEEKRPFGRPRRRWDNNIKLILKMGSEGVY